MEGFLRKQGSKLKEQIAKQQQAILKQFSGDASSQGPDIFGHEAEIQRHQLEGLYKSTRENKHFQRDIVRGTEGYMSAGSKQLEVYIKLAEDCCKYATDGPNSMGALAKGSNLFGNSVRQLGKEREMLHKALGTQVAEPLRAMVTATSLEDARRLCERYDRLRQEAEALAGEVSRRELKLLEGGGSVENAQKLQAAEGKLRELTSAMVPLGKEAAAAMIAVEAQQQHITLQRLIAMVEAERLYYRRAAESFDYLHTQMVAERQCSEVNPSLSRSPDSYNPPPAAYDEVKFNGIDNKFGAAKTQKAMFFSAEVVQSFEGESSEELSLTMGDYVIVRQVDSNGWSEGECKGKCGWFPTSHVERRERGPTRKGVEEADTFF